MLHLHFSNRHEVLAERLARALMPSRRGVFGTERVLVPSAAWQRWLSIHLAHRLGVCAQIEFGFLAPWLWRALPPDDSLRTPAPDTDTLAWRCWAWLGDPATHHRHPQIARWLAAGAGEEHEPRTRYELARRAAELIEQVETWRPAWRDAWARGTTALPDDVSADLRRHEAWQADLWRHLRGSDDADPSGLASGDAVGIGTGDAEAVHVFAPASMPPVHLAALRRLAAGRDIHAYLFNPCREYWFDLVSPRRFSHLALAGRLGGHEVGHALLTRWGAAVQAQLVQWNEAAGEEAVLDDGHYVARADAIAAPSLLERVQDSLLTLEEPTAGEWASAAGDRSLEVHLCHSRQRELEVLLDRLLGLLAADPGLGPGDIWVGVTDLDATAPLIEAVFGAATGARALPFTITGRSTSQGDGCAADLLALLDLAGSRCTATALLGVLQAPRVAAALGLDETTRADAVAALNDAGLRWGLDDAHLAAHGAQPHGHTLADAIARLVLGACLPVDPQPALAAAVAASVSVEDTVAATLPWPAAVPAGQAGWRLLGALQRWAQALTSLSSELRRARPALAWQRLVEQVLHQMLQPPASPAEVAARQPLQRAIAAVSAAAHRAVGPSPLPWSAMREALADALEAPARGGVAGGGVTFSALSPLRGLPFRVVAVLGLDDGLFPNPQRPPEFDLIAALPQPGDRQRRLDDRGLMLEALLACRGTLHLSAIGRSAVDNSVRPPSVVVSELLEWLLPAMVKDHGAASEWGSARRQIVVEHPLQPFDLTAYDAQADPRARSSEPAAHEAWAARLRPQTAVRAGPADRVATNEEPDDTADDPLDESTAASAVRRLGADTEAPPFVDGPLPGFADDPAPEGAVDAVDLGQWLRHPARHWLRRGLGLAVWRDDDTTEDQEDLVAGDRGAARRLWHHWLPLLLAADAAAEPPPLEQASTWTARAGIGPGGRLGAAWIAREWPRLLDFAAAVRQARQECDAAAAATGATDAPVDPSAAFDIRLAMPGRTLVLRGVQAAGPQAVFWHVGRRNGAHVAQAWLQHLFALAAAPGRWDAAQVRTLLLHPGAAGSTEILRTVWPPLPVEQAREHLATLLELHQRARHEPLPLLPRTGWAWVESGGKPALARSIWEGGIGASYGEGQDPSWRLLLRGRPDPFADLSFVPLAETVFGPAWQALGEAASASEVPAGAASPGSADGGAP